MAAASPAPGAPDLAASLRSTTSAAAAGVAGTHGDTLARTTNSRRTMVRGGVVVAVPFATSSKPFVRTYGPAIAYGQHDDILNPPNKDRTTTVRATHNKTAVTVQSAGTLHKTPVPYHPEAARNRVDNPTKRIAPPFSSTLSMSAGIFNKPLRPYRTIASATQAPSATPMHERCGFSNPEIASAVAKTLHARVFS